MNLAHSPNSASAGDQHVACDLHSHASSSISSPYNPQLRLQLQQQARRQAATGPHLSAGPQQQQYQQHQHQYQYECQHHYAIQNPSPSIYSTGRSSSANFIAAAIEAQQQQQLGSSAPGSLLAQSDSQRASVQCLRFKYFATFVLCTASLALLAGSLATHKWLVSRPTRLVRLTNGQTANFTALMLSSTESISSQMKGQQRDSGGPLVTLVPSSAPDQRPSPFQGKFQGEIYFGLFNGLKVLNYGFGERVSQVSVLQVHHASPRDNPSNNNHNAFQLVNFNLWLATLTGVLLALLFALIGSIFALINFVLTPRATFSGPVGLVVWNAAASFSCLLAMFAWLVEYFLRLKANVLTPEEVINGWTSENRSQFGYSYYMVVMAFVLHLVGIFVVSIVQASTWTSRSWSKAQAKRQSRANACDGVIMLY